MSDTPPNRAVVPLRVLSMPGAPQRYAVNSERYEARGGLTRPAEDARGFLTEPSNIGDMARFWSFCLIFDQIVKEGLKGDFAELGVYKGHTASLLATMARRLGARLYLLDTFAGFSGADLKGIDSGVVMGFEDTSVEAVRALVGDQNVTFVPGHFPSSAVGLPPEASYCLVHVDCDLYAPMLSALEYFWPRLIPGGFMILHDYSSLHWNGAERAIDEFFASRAESVMPLPDNAGSAVARKARTPRRHGNWLVRRNAALCGPEWTEVRDNRLAPILGEGWSFQEDWGIWGLDAAHQIFVFLDAPPTQDMDLEFDVNALLLGSRIRQEVDVWVDGRVLQTWTFTHDQNNGVRNVRVPLALLDTEGAALPAILVEFRPRSVAAARDLDPGNGDERRLGVALHRLRRTR